MMTREIIHSTEKKTPGYDNPRFNIKAELILHTRTAQSMFQGIWKPGQMGLVQFAEVCKDLFYSYMADDPYANLVILSTYQQLHDAIAKCKEIENQIQLIFDNLKGIKLVSMQGDTDWCEPLNFTTFCPYLGAELLGHVDHIFLQLNTLRRFGLNYQDSSINHKSIKRIVQDIFSFPRKWHRTGVTRKDILENNLVAIKAKSALIVLGELPEDILNKKIELSFLPKI